MQSIYVGNLNWGMSSEQLQEVFEKVGTVSSSRVITDRETGRSRGFGFVEMSVEDANKAVSELDGQEIEGRNLKVNLAEDKKKPSNNNYSRDNNNSYNDRSGNGNGGSNYNNDSFQDYDSKPRSKKNWGSNSY